MKNFKTFIKEYPKAGEKVSNLTVRKEIPNITSIKSSFNKYELLSGIREVPMSDFYVTGKSYSVEGSKRILELTNEIKNSKEINPLIVAIDKQGPYILEGSTRIDALYNLGVKTFPALVVYDKDEE
jgi:hypothetical protein